MSFEKSPDETIAEILGRWTVSDLREQSNDDLRIGDERFYNAKNDLKIIEKGRNGMIDFWKIESDGKTYEARRFKNFVFCSCKSFFFSKKICKHLALTTGVYCSHCRTSRANVGKLCFNCDMTQKHFLRPTGGVAAAMIS